MRNFMLKQNGAQVQKAIDYALQVPQLSEAIADETTAIENAINDIKAQGLQQTPAIPQGNTVTEQLAWLAENGDPSKTYLLEDNYLYQWRYAEKEVTTGESYTNRLPKATDTDRTTIYGADYNGDGVNDGYLKNTRLSSSGSTSDRDGAYASGFVSVTVGDVLRIKGIAPLSGLSQYVITYNGTTKVTHKELLYTSGGDWSTTANFYTYADGILTIPLTSANFGSAFNGVRFSCGYIDENTIVTINEEIKESTTTIVKEYAWTNTGCAFVPADYEERITDAEKRITRNAADIADLKKGAIDTNGMDALSWIRQWDAPIYDRMPVFLLDTEKAALTSSDKTVAAVYAKYDALMAANPRYITKTNLGYCSDGVTPVYRYDFCEPESRHQSGFEWSETKPKFIIVTGIHREWNGIYGMFHALSEITTNSELTELRRSVHFIVIPVLNPYSILGDYSVVGHAANANGVEIHRNFEIGFKVQNEGTFQYSGATPLSEVESQYLDDVLKANTDAAYFLTCHSFDRDKTWGVGFLWGSSATKYMCNMAFRVIDKMGRAWHEKYGTTWEDGIARENAVVLSDSTKYPNAKALETGDYRIGHAALTNTGGCEQRQATKYGIQATNFETGETFFVLDQTMLSAKAITHSAEAYINFFLTAMDCYDFKDKKQYFVG